MKEPKMTTIKKNGCIAIIGMSGRFPGAINIDEFWLNLKNGVESVRKFSDEELRASGIDPINMSKFNYVKAGAILDDVDMFDAEFFDMTARDAEGIDPQQRLMLECAWESLENAGYPPGSFPGSIGVFVGSRISEYLMYKIATPDMCGLFPESGSLVSNWKRILDNDKDTLATRIAFKLDLKGPALNIQTACSTSLVAVHMGCQSLRRGESDMVLAGGACVRVPQKAGYLYSEGMIFSPDGHTRAFDAKGEGTIFSNGAGVVALKLLDKAMADGDNIHAVIRGSAINNDGNAMKAAFTAPSADGQAKVIAKALSAAEVDPGTISYIEAHGTATTTGDLTEITSLTKAFQSEGDPRELCALGTVKSNIGHPTQAAGIIGLIKTALMLEHRKLVPHANFEEANSKIGLVNSPFYVNTELKEWITENLPRRAGINSFGVGGTNAHVILEEGQLPEYDKADTDCPVQIFCLSAKNVGALKDLVKKYDKFLKLNPKPPLADICYTANAGRTHFDHRLAFVASSPESLREELSTKLINADGDNISGLHVVGANRPTVAFLFSGQGSQYVNMGRQLFDTQPEFRKSLEKCDRLLRPYLEESILSVLYPSSTDDGQHSSKIDETLYTQTSLFAIEYSLYALWKSWGVEPDVVMGHSVGEFVAACVAGVFGLEDGLRLIAARGKLMQELPGNGAMAAVLADFETVNKHLKDTSAKIDIAAVNGPASVVVSGEQEALDAVLHVLEKEGLKVKRLKVSHAFHSHLVEPIMESFERVAAGVDYGAPALKLISNVTGQVVEGQDMANARYWRNHLRAPVMFASSMKTIENMGCQTFLEIGPGSTLLGMGRLCVETTEGHWLASFKRQQAEWPQMLKSLGALYADGMAVDWAGFYKDGPKRRTPLPTYPFQRQRYWIDHICKDDGLVAKQAHSRPDRFNAKGHPLLGCRLSSALNDIQFESRLNTTSTIFLKDHQVFGVVVVPASALIEMLLSAVSEVVPRNEVYALEDLVIREALILPEDEDLMVQTVLTPEDTDQYAFRIFSTSNNNGETSDDWKLNVFGKVRKDAPSRSRLEKSLPALRQRCRAQVTISEIYRDGRARGMNHGPSFQALAGIWRGEGEALARIELPDQLPVEAETYSAHPVLLDAAFQLGKVTFPEFKSNAEYHEIYLPTIVERIRTYGRFDGSLWCYAVIRSNGASNPELRTVDNYLFDLEGRLVAEIQGLHFKRATRKSIRQLAGEESFNRMLYELKWQPKPLAGVELVSQDHAGIWIVFSDGRGVGAELGRRLRETGQNCIMVFPGVFENNTDGNTCHLNPRRPEDYHKLIQYTCTLRGEFRGVVYLWGMDNGIERTAHDYSPMDRPLDACVGGLHLIQALATENITEPPALWFVSRGAQPIGAANQTIAVEQVPLWGLAKVAAREHPKLRCAMVDLDPDGEQEEIAMLVDELWSDDFENQIGFRQQKRYAPRLVRAQKPTDKAASLQAPDAENYGLEPAGSGTLGGLSLQPAQRVAPGRGEVEIRVEAAGLNFRDVLTALGKYPGDPGPLGRECSGTITTVGDSVAGLKAGDAVLAIGPGCFCRYATLNAFFVVKKPDFLSFADAAGIPITFMTVYHGLHNLCRLTAGEKVLIHAAAGGVGLSAIQLVRQAGAEVYATASPGKWEFLESMGIRHIMNSRTLDFADEVMRLTDGQGVDIVLNSLAGEFIPRSLSVLGDKGRFIEIGKNDIWSKAQVKKYRPDISYYPFDLGDVGRNDPENFQAMFKVLMRGFNEGSYTPLPQKRYPIEDAPHAFRYMAQAKHIGKIVVSQQGLTNRSGGRLRSDRTYLITGGLGALGLQIAGWMTAKGVKHLVLLGRGQPTEYAKQVIKKMEAGGGKVSLVQADVSDKEQLAGVLREIGANMPELSGVIHAAGVLDDGVLLQQTTERFEKVMAPKVAGAWHLHELTQNMSLDFLVLFSSISALWGTPGQANYAAANAYLDGLSHYRRAQGLPCISVNWGSWAEVGMAATLDSKIKQRKKTRGLQAIDLESGLEILENIINGKSAQTAVVDVNWSEYLKQFPGGVAPPFLSEMVGAETEHADDGKNGQVRKSGLLDRIKSAPVNDREHILFDAIRKQAFKMIGLGSGEHLDPQTPLVDIGLDSLSAIELRNSLENSIEKPLPATLLYDHPTLEELSEYLSGQILQDKLKTDDHSEDSPDDAQADAHISRSPENNARHESEHGSIPEQWQDPQGRGFSSLVPIQTGGACPPLFLVHLPNPLHINQRLGSEQPLYYFRGLWGEETLPLEVNIVDLAADNLEKIKRVQPEGPYFLSGYSVGGLIALEMAQQIHRRGEQVAMLYLLEPLSPAIISSGVLRKTNLQSSINRTYFSSDNIRNKTKSALRNIVERAYNCLNTIIDNSKSIPLRTKLDYTDILHKLEHKKYFSNTSTGRTIIFKVKQSIIASGKSLPPDYRKQYVYNLYGAAQRKYCANTYPGKVVICRVMKKSTVDLLAWKKLAIGGLELKELSVEKHHDLIYPDENSEWVFWLENCLENAIANCTVKDV